MYQNLLKRGQVTLRAHGVSLHAQCGGGGADQGKYALLRSACGSDNDMLDTRTAQGFGAQQTAVLTRQTGFQRQADIVVEGETRG
jgi:hypothetical protein